MSTFNISIIVPVYNVEKYILRCLQSVACQTMSEGVECILVDDCGSDNSMEIVEDFVQDYHGSIAFRIYHHDNNRGLSAARNSGLKVAKGEYVYFLDSDDDITPDCMFTLWNIVNEYPGVDLIQASFVSNPKYACNRHIFLKNPYLEDCRLIKSMMLDYTIVPVTAQNRLIRRALIFENNIWFKPGIIHEDNHWTFFLAKHVRTMACCEKGLYNHYRNPGSITTNINVAKEIFSWDVIIRDFCNNIDGFMSGHQRLSIFYILSNVIKNKYYKDERTKEELIGLFSKRCGVLERFLLKLWFGDFPLNRFNAKLERVLVRIFIFKERGS